MRKKRSKKRAMQLFRAAAGSSNPQPRAGVTDVLDEGDTPSCSASCHRGREAGTEGVLPSGARERKQTGEPLNSFLK